MNRFLQIAQLVNTCKRIEGRVKFQKVVHILQEAGFPFHEEFGYLHHGPYSSELTREIEQLQNWDLLKEDIETVGDYTRYRYSATDTLDVVERELQIETDAPAPWATIAKELNSKSAQELEAISTIMFLRRRGFGGDRLRTRFSQLKPHLINRFEASLDHAKKLQRSIN